MGEIKNGFKLIEWLQILKYFEYEIQIVDNIKKYLKSNSVCYQRVQTKFVEIGPGYPC